MKKKNTEKNLIVQYEELIDKMLHTECLLRTEIQKMKSDALKKMFAISSKKMSVFELDNSHVGEICEYQGGLYYIKTVGRTFFYQRKYCIISPLIVLSDKKKKLDRLDEIRVITITYNK